MSAAPLRVGDLIHDGVLVNPCRVLKVYGPCRCAHIVARINDPNGADKYPWPEHWHVTQRMEPFRGKSGDCGYLTVRGVADDGLLVTGHTDESERVEWAYRAWRIVGRAKPEFVQAELFAFA